MRKTILNEKDLGVLIETLRDAHIERGMVADGLRNKINSLNSQMESKEIARLTAQAIRADAQSTMAFRVFLAIQALLNGDDPDQLQYFLED